jgi:hypothetical protein
MRIFRYLVAGAFALFLSTARSADFYNESEAGDVALRTFAVTNTSYVWTNAERTILRPVSIEFSAAAGITNTFSVKHVRVDRYSQYPTNSYVAPTNTVYLRTTNYWLLADTERGRYGNSMSITNDSSVTLTVVGEPYIGVGDEITFSHTPVATTDVTRTHVVLKEQ